MNGLAELLVANGGTLLTFAIFIGERIIQAAKDRTSTKQRIDDETVRAYLEWLRQQDHVLLLHTIEEKHDELVAYLAGDAARLKEVIEKTLENPSGCFRQSYSTTCFIFYSSQLS